MDSDAPRKASTPRLSGRVLTVLSSVVRSPAGGALRRYLGAQLVDSKLGDFDFEAHGSPAPLYMPEAYRREGIVSGAFHGIADFGAAYKSGRLTPRDVIERALDANQRWDAASPPWRAFISVLTDEARHAADESTQRLAQGRARSPLEGVPVAVKDEFDVVGRSTTCGTSFLGKTPAAQDALVVARLRAAGAVLLGKTNMHELGVNPSGINLHHGTARNPYDLTRDTGGSSSGSGAAVASGIVPLALGNDGGGSVRIPAAVCGTVGLKATFARIPTDGVAVLCWSLEHSGPLTSSVEDARLALEILTAEPAPLPALPSPLRLGICDAWWREADPEVQELVRAAAAHIPGARLVSIELPHIELATAVGTCTFLAEGAASVDKHLAANAPFSPSVRMAFDAARGVSAPSFVKAQRMRALILRGFEAALSECDAIISPTTAIVAPPYPHDALLRGEVDEAKINAMVHFTFPLNLTGLPALSVPCAYSREGLPVGMQIVTPHGEDTRALAIGALVDRATERRRPPLFVDLLA